MTALQLPTGITATASPHEGVGAAPTPHPGAEVPPAHARMP